MSDELASMIGRHDDLMALRLAQREAHVLPSPELVDALSAGFGMRREDVVAHFDESTRVLVADRDRRRRERAAFYRVRRMIWRGEL